MRTVSSLWVFTRRAACSLRGNTEATAAFPTLSVSSASLACPALPPSGPCSHTQSPHQLWSVQRRLPQGPVLVPLALQSPIATADLGALACLAFSHTPVQTHHPLRRRRPCLVQVGGMPAVCGPPRDEQQREVGGNIQTLAGIWIVSS